MKENLFLLKSRIDVTKLKKAPTVVAPNGSALYDACSIRCCVCDDDDDDCAVRIVMVSM